MLAIAIISFAVAAVLLVALVFARAALRRATEREASALAQSFAREAKATAERKLTVAAAADTKHLEEATHEELLRIARDLARRD